HRILPFCPFRFHKQEILFYLFSLYINQNGIASHMPFHMAENMLRLGKRLNTQSFQPPGLHLFQGLAAVKPSQKIRQLIKARQKSLLRPFMNGRPLSVADDKHRSLLNLSGLFRRFYRETAGQAPHSSKTQIPKGALPAFRGSVWHAYN